MQLTIDTRGLTPALDRLAEMPRQARFAGVKALTYTAQKVARAEEREMLDSFDRPTRRTMQSIYVVGATKERPQAVVGVKDSFGNRGDRGQIAYLRWQIYGGSRTEKAFERALLSGGAMRKGDRAVPGRFARLDAYGNISQGQIKQILSQLRIDATVGSTRSLPRFAFEDTKKDRQQKKRRIAKAFEKAGGQFLALPDGRGRLPAGIYQTRATAFGRSDPRPVIIFVPGARYETRFDFHYAARTAVLRHLGPETERAVAEALADPKVRA